MHLWRHSVWGRPHCSSSHKTTSERHADPSPGKLLQRSGFLTGRNQNKSAKTRRGDEGGDGPWAAALSAGLVEAGALMLNDSLQMINGAATLLQRSWGDTRTTTFSTGHPRLLWDAIACQRFKLITQRLLVRVSERQTFYKDDQNLKDELVHQGTLLPGDTEQLQGIEPSHLRLFETIASFYDRYWFKTQ